MLLSELVVIPLGKAYFCETDQVVVNVPKCPICASNLHMERMDRWIPNTEEPRRRHAA